MIENMYLTAEAMNTHVARQEVIANNLANANTVGFKRDDAFQDLLSDMTVEDGQIRQMTDFSQGAVRRTDNPMDFALTGNGFFTIETPEGIRFSRNGHFQLDSEGQLVIEGGGSVMGEQGPIYIRDGIQVDEKGAVYQHGQYLDKLRIVSFENPHTLEKTGNSLFAPGEGSLEMETASVAVKQGYLEESNVNAVREMVNMMTLFRYFEADQKALKTQDDLLSRAVNEIGKV